MRIKNAFKLLGTDFSVVYKLLLYRLIITLLIFGVGIAVIIPYGRMIIAYSNITAVIRSGLAVINNLFLPSAEFQSTFAAEFEVFTSYVTNHLFKVYWIIFYFWGLFELSQFLLRFGNFALGNITNAHMASMQKLGFIPALFRNMGKAAIYSLIETAISAAFLLLTIVAAFLISFIPIEEYTVIPFFLTVLISLMIQSFKRTIISLYLPSIIADEMGPIRGFNNGVALSFGDFWRIFSSYFFLLLVGIYVNISAALFTVGVGLLFTIPLTVLVFVNFQFVNYYKLSVKKYFISYDEIIIPKQMREEESLLTDIDI